MKSMKKKSLFFGAMILSMILMIMIPGRTASAADSLNTNSEYYITSAKYDGYVINTYVTKASSIKNGTSINLYKLLNGGADSTQRFKPCKYGNNAYLFKVAGNTKFTLNIGSRKANTNILCWQDKAANNEGFVVESAGNGYYTMKLASNPKLYLTATSNSKLTLKTKSNGTDQKFKFTEYKTKSNTNQSGISVTTILNMLGIHNYNLSGNNLPGIVKDVMGDIGNFGSQCVNAFFGNGSITTNTKEKKLSVTDIKQYDKKWKNYHYVNCTTIGENGCLITSMTMVYYYKYGVVNRPDVFAKNFMVFNKSGYAIGGEWNKVKSMKYNMNEIKKMIDSYQPVLVRRYFYNNRGERCQHWAVVYGYTNGGKNEGDFLIYDPAYSKDTTLRKFASRGFSLQAFTY